jgi:hypothetical protein
MSRSCRQASTHLVIASSCHFEGFAEADLSTMVGLKIRLFVILKQQECNSASQRSCINSYSQLLRGFGPHIVPTVCRNLQQLLEADLTDEHLPESVSRRIQDLSDEIVSRPRIHLHMRSQPIDIDKRKLGGQRRFDSTHRSMVPECSCRGWYGEQKLLQC